MDEGIADSSHSKFIMSCRSMGASNLSEYVIRSLCYSLNSEKEVDLNIARHDEGLWYNLVSVFCD